MPLLTNLRGVRPPALGLAAHPQQDPRCVSAAFDQGLRYFFFYGPSETKFTQGLQPLVRTNRDELLLATGSGGRTRRTLLASRRKAMTSLKLDVLDVFFAEYIHPGEKLERVFDADGVLDELQTWKQNGWIRFVGATVHDRGLAARLAEDPRVDVLMHRFNMAHRKARDKVFPHAKKAKTPVVAFTATRWATLLAAPAGWTGPPATAGDCYRYCLAERAVQIVLTAPRSLQELAENVEVLHGPAMPARERRRWEAYGDLLRGEKQTGFETRWP